MSEPNNYRMELNPHPGLRYTLLQKWTKGDVLVGVATGCISVILLMSLNLFHSVIICAVLLALNWPFNYGHLWWELVCHLHDGYIKWVLRDTLYLNSDMDHDPAAVRFLRQKRYHFLRPERRYVFPIRHSVVVSKGKIHGIYQHLDRPLDVIPVRGHGSSHGSLDSGTQERATKQLARNIDGVSIRMRDEWGQKLGISSLRLSRPHSGASTVQYFLDNGQPVVFYHELFDLDRATAKVMTGLRDNTEMITPTQQAYGVIDSWQLMLATSKRTSDMRKAMNNQHKKEHDYDFRLIQVGELIVQAIEGCELNIREVHCLNYLELCQLTRAAWDVTDLSYLDYDSDGNIELVTQEDVENPDSPFGLDDVGQLKDPSRVLVTEEDVSDPDSPYGAGDLGTLKDPFHVLPNKSIVTGNDFICLDDNWISSFMITEGLEEYHVSEIQRIYHDDSPAGMFTSRASAGQHINGEMATTVEVWKNRGIEDFSLRQSHEHPKRRNRRQAREREENQLSLYSRAQRYHEVFTVVAKTKEELMTNRATVMANLQLNGLKCRVIKGRSRQLDAFITGAYGINRL